MFNFLNLEKKYTNLRIFWGVVLLSRLDKWKFGILIWSKKFTIHCPIYFISIFLYWSRPGRSASGLPTPPPRPSCPQGSAASPPLYTSATEPIMIMKQQSVQVSAIKLELFSFRRVLNIWTKSKTKKIPTNVSKLAWSEQVLFKTRTNLWQLYALFRLKMVKLEVLMVKNWTTGTTC